MKTKTIFFVLLALMIVSITVLQSSCNKTIGNLGGSAPVAGFTDPRDGQTYATVEIGSQTWFAENLNYETTNSWWYNNDLANGDVYGRLYTWDAALTACPAGWHLPSDDEWKTLEMYLGMSQSEADFIKETKLNKTDRLPVGSNETYTVALLQCLSKIQLVSIQIMVLLCVFISFLAL